MSRGWCRGRTTTRGRMTVSLFPCARVTRRALTHVPVQNSPLSTASTVAPTSSRPKASSPASSASCSVRPFPFSSLPFLPSYQPCTTTRRHRPPLLPASRRLVRPVSTTLEIGRREPRCDCGRGGVGRGREEEGYGRERGRVVRVGDLSGLRAEEREGRRRGGDRSARQRVTDGCIHTYIASITPEGLKSENEGSNLREVDERTFRDGPLTAASLPPFRRGVQRFFTIQNGCFDRP